MPQLQLSNEHINLTR